VPRLINVTCDRALLGAYTEDQHRIDAATARRAASEVFGKPISPRWITWAGGGAAVIALITLVFGVRLLTESSATPAPAATVNVPAPAAAVEIPKPVAAVADIGSLLASAQTENTTESAFAKLLALWNAEYRKDIARPCEQALEQGLECVYQKGSWGQLRILNRPVILSLTDDTGRAHQVVLTSLNDSSAQVVLADAPQEVSLSSLSKFWLGDYLLVWRPQSTGQRALAVGMRGDEVRWLRRSLDRLQNLPPAAEDLANDYYDEALAKRVETFQREHRLTIDGIAGVQTQIVLDSAVDASNAPRLLSMQSAPTNGRQTT